MCEFDFRQAQGMQKFLYVGLDAHKASISVSTAEDGREGAVNFIGTAPNTPAALLKLRKRLAERARGGDHDGSPRNRLRACLANVLGGCDIFGYVIADRMNDARLRSAQISWKQRLRTGHPQM